jgi:hypothetical protein
MIVEVASFAGTLPRERVLRYVRAHCAIEGQPPTIREIAAGLHISRRMAEYWLGRLLTEGTLCAQGLAGSARNIRLPTAQYTVRGEVHA